METPGPPCNHCLYQATIIEKISWDAWSILVVVFLTASSNFRLHFWNNNVHVAWTLLQPISLPYPHQTMLREPTRKLTTWLLSTLYRGRGGQIKVLPLNHPNSFFNDCTSRSGRYNLTRFREPWTTTGFIRLVQGVVGTIWLDLGSPVKPLALSG